MQRAFLQLLNRPAAATEVANRVSQLRGGTSAAYNAFIEDLFSSPEYTMLMGS